MQWVRTCLTNTMLTLHNIEFRQPPIWLPSAASLPAHIINSTKTLESASLMQLLACKGQINSTDPHKCRCVLDKHSLCIFVLPAIRSREAGVCSYVRAYVSISIRAPHTNRHRNSNHAATVLYTLHTYLRKDIECACLWGSLGWLTTSEWRVKAAVLVSLPHFHSARYLAAK